MPLHQLGLSIGFGLITASVLALAGVGLTLQVGVTNLVNFAVGEFLTLGAYFTLYLNQQVHLNFWLSLVIAAGLMGPVAVAANIFIIRPFVKKGMSLVFLLIVTMALSIVMQNGIVAIWGGGYQSYDLPISQPITLGPFLFTGDQLLIIGIAALMMVAVHLLLTRTKIGKGMRAMSDDVNLAQACGINTESVTNLVWLLSGFLTGLAGIVLAINVGTFTPGLGTGFLYVIFAAVVLGGLGSPYGAMLGALVIGLSTEVSAFFVSSSYKNDIAFGILILFVLFRRQGLIRMAGKA